MHAQIEEEIFYPAVKVALKDELLVPEATVEHAGVRDLIAQLEGIEPDGEMYDAKVKVLSEYVKQNDATGDGCWSRHSEVSINALAPSVRCRSPGP